MAVYKDKKRGTWYALIRYTDDEGNPKSKMKRGFELKRDAINYEHEFRQSLNRKVTSNDVLNFEEVANRYFESNYANATQDTINHKKRIVKVFLSNLNKKRVSRINNLLIKEQLNLISSTDYSRNYKNMGIQLFKSILTFAKVYLGIDTNYELITTIPKTSNDHFSYQTWNDEEFNQFISRITHPVYHALFTLLYRTGMRRGEALALHKSDIKGNQLSITKHYRLKSEGVTKLKTYSSLRTILIDDETLKILQPFLKGQGFLFGDDFPLAISNIGRVFKQGIKDSGVKPIRLHDLRHSHATNLINKGANIVAVSKRLGHSDVSMTLKTYTHLLENEDEKLLKLI